MSFVLVDEDGAEMSAPESDSADNVGTGSECDGDFEEVYVDTREVDIESRSSDYVKVNNSQLSSALAQMVLEDSDTESRDATEWSATRNAETIEQFSHLQVIQSRLKLYNQRAVENFIDSCFVEEQSLRQLLSEFRLRPFLEKFDESIAAGFIASLSGNIDRILGSVNSDCMLFSDELNETCWDFDDLMKISSSFPINEFDNDLLKFIIGQYYRRIGDIFASRFYARNFNNDGRETLNVFAVAAYLVSLQYLENLKFGGSKTIAVTNFAVCEMKLCISFALEYYKIEDTVFDLILDPEFGKNLSHAFWNGKAEEEKQVDDTFLARNKIDFSYIKEIPQFDFQKDFMNNLDAIWQLSTEKCFLAHFLFVVGYSRTTDYMFLGRCLPNLNLEKSQSNDLTSLIDLFDATLIIISFSVNFCRITNSGFGYDYKLRKAVNIPPPEIDAIDYAAVDRNFVVPVARHPEIPVVTNFFWKLLLRLGGGCEEDRRQDQLFREFGSQTGVRELIYMVLREVNLDNRLHNSYIVSERMHLLLYWKMASGFSDVELAFIQSRLDRHLMYMEKLRPESYNFSEEEIYDAETRGGMAEQLFPNIDLNWLIYPVNSNCAGLHPAAVQEMITYYRMTELPPESPEWKVYRSRLSSSFLKQAAAIKRSKEPPPVPGSYDALLASEMMELAAKRFRLPCQKPCEWSRIIRMHHANTGFAITDEMKRSRETFKRALKDIYAQKEAERSVMPKPSFTPKKVPQFDQKMKDILDYKQAVSSSFQHSLNEHGKQLGLLVAQQKEVNYHYNKLFSLNIMAGVCSASFPLQQALWLANATFYPEKVTNTPPPPFIVQAQMLIGSICQRINANELIYYRPPLSEFIEFSSAWAETVLLKNAMANISLPDRIRIVAEQAEANGTFASEERQVLDMWLRYKQDMERAARISRGGPHTAHHNPHTDGAVPAHWRHPKLSDNSQMHGSDRTHTHTEHHITPPETPRTPLSELLKEVDEPSQPAKINNGFMTNEAFRQAFEKWRGINKDTPEEVRAHVFPPSLTKQQIALYKPTHTLTGRQEAHALFPPRQTEISESDEQSRNDHEDEYDYDECDDEYDEDEDPEEEEEEENSEEEAEECTEDEEDD